MTKLKEGPITEEDISKYLAEQDDFALELRTLKQARSHAFFAMHGGTYEDPITKKARQYDVRASYSRNSHAVRLAVECKSLQENFPLVVSRLPRGHSESFHNRIHAEKNRLPALNIQTLKPSGLYPVDEWVGKSTVQIGLNVQGHWVTKDDEVHEKWSQAIHSSYEVIRTDSPMLHQSVTAPWRTVVIPVLVISEKTLWCVDYDADGSLSSKPRQVDEVLMFVDRKFPVDNQHFAISHLHICTETGFDQFLRRICGDNNWWNSAFA